MTITQKNIIIKNMKELTKKQRTVLSFLQKNSKMASPPVREIYEDYRKRYNLPPGNIKTVQEILFALEKKGYIKRHKGARNIEILNKL